MSINKFLSPAIAFALLFGAVSCTVGPNYQSPNSDVPALFAATKPSSETASTQPTTRSMVESSTTAPAAQWWTTLNDPELNRLIDQAVAGNIDLKEAASRLRESRASLQLAGANNLPKVDATGAYAHIDAGKGVSLGNSGPLAMDIWQIGFDSSWEIDVFGGQRRVIEAAAADFQAAIEDRRDVLVSMTAELARDYLQVRGLQERVRLARENLALQEDTLGLTRSLRRAGFNTELDVDRAQTQVNQTRAAIVPLVTQLRQQQHAIAILLGQPPESMIAELSTPAALPTLPASVSIGLPSDLLRRRPDIRRAERQIAAANARVGAAIADYYPKFSLTGDFGLDSTQFQHLFNWENRYFIIYPSVDWRIFDFGRTAAQVEQEKERHQQALLAYQNAVLNALREVEDSLIAYENEQDHHDALAAAVASARESLEISRDEYKQGVIDFLPVLDVQRQLLAAQDELAQSDQALSTNLAGLYKSLGGGWYVESR
jgi:NodT family efflux transporter outer membrane factor (OMF) lipoprotein